MIKIENKQKKNLFMTAQKNMKNKKIYEKQAKK